MPDTRLASLAVLVVDDDRPMRALLDEMLAAIGVAEVRAAADSAEALAILRRFPADLVLCAEGAGPEGGFALARQLRRDAAALDRRLPVVMLAAAADPARLAAARAAGASGILSRPVTTRTLHQRLTAALDEAPPTG